jgi:hypothetical protein
MGQVDAKAERVENIGGTMEELEAKVAPVQEEIKEVQKNAGEQIAAVENNEKESNSNLEKQNFLESVENLKTELAPYLDMRIKFDTGFGVYDFTEHIQDENYVGGAYSKQVEFPQEQQKKLIEVFKKYYLKNPKKIGDSELKYIPISYGSGSTSKNTFTVRELLNEVEKDFA